MQVLTRKVPAVSPALPGGKRPEIGLDPRAARRCPWALRAWWQHHHFPCSREATEFLPRWGSCHQALTVGFSKSAQRWGVPTRGVMRRLGRYRCLCCCSKGAVSPYTGPDECRLWQVLTQAPMLNHRQHPLSPSPHKHPHPRMRTPQGCD